MIHVRKKEFFELMGVIIACFGFIALVMMYFTPQTWSNDTIRTAIALTMLIFAMTVLLAHHITLEIDRLLEAAS